MLRIILRWVLFALFLMLLPSFIEGIQINSLGTALLVIVVLGIINAILRPALLILTLPVNIITLGLFTLVLNALLFWAASFVKGFDIAGFFPAFWGALAFSIFTWLVNFLDKSEYKFGR